MPYNYSVLLICSAWDQEIKWIKPDPGYKLATLGIGYLDAALNLEAILSENKIDEILFLGTAGSYSEDLKIGEIVEIAEVGLLNIGEVLGQAYTPKEIPSLRGAQRRGNPVNKVSCLSSLEITKDENLSKKIIQHYNSKFLVENMELYGVAKVANKKQIPWSALLGVTNYTNENAHQDWKTNHIKLSEKLCASFSEPYALHQN